MPEERGMPGGSNESEVPGMLSVTQPSEVVLRRATTDTSSSSLMAAATQITTASTTIATSSSSQETSTLNPHSTERTADSSSSPSRNVLDEQQQHHHHNYQYRQHRRSHRRQQREEQLQQQLLHTNATTAAITATLSTTTTNNSQILKSNTFLNSDLTQGDGGQINLLQPEGHELLPNTDGRGAFPQEQQGQGHVVNTLRLQLTLHSVSTKREEAGAAGRADVKSSLAKKGGRSTPYVVVTQLSPGSNLETLEVGDRILQVNGDPVEQKTLEEVSSLLSASTDPVSVLLERDLSPLKKPTDDTEKPVSSRHTSPLTSTLLGGGVSTDGAVPGQNGDSCIETVIVQDTPVMLRPKNSLRAKGHSPNRRRSKSPSPCPNSRQKSVDLSRSHSFTSQSEHRVFRPTDLLLGEVLGQGFFGQAIKAVHRVTGEIVVLKELHNFDEDAQKSFLREVSMLRNVSHPCVLRFLGVLYRDKKLNLVTEFIDGGTLSSLLLDHSTQLSWKQRVTFAKDIAKGMSYLHSVDIIHRDLNSQNCLVRKDQSVVVADFGLAKICPRHDPPDFLLSKGNKWEDTLNTIGEGGSQPASEAGPRTARGGPRRKRFTRRKRQTVVGNPYWMAPEMMTKGVYDEKVDVFSFGIIVCETIARVTADPDYLPRSIDFGLNVEAFHKRFCEDVPEPYFMLAVLCSQLEPDQRPSFERISMLCEALSLHVEHKMAVPTELQGSTVQFYRRFKVEAYGKDFRDIDSCSQADTDSGQKRVDAGGRGNEHSVGSDDQSVVATETLIEPSAQQSVPTTEPSCLNVSVVSHEDQAYFSCPSSSPPASPSCQILSKGETSLTEQFSDLQSESATLGTDVRQAPLHKPTSRSLGDMTPCSQAGPGSYDQGRALRNGSVESGIFAECPPFDATSRARHVETRSLDTMSYSSDLLLQSQTQPQSGKLVSTLVGKRVTNSGAVLNLDESTVSDSAHFKLPVSSFSRSVSLTAASAVDSTVCGPQGTLLSGVIQPQLDEETESLNSTETGFSNA